MDPQELVVLEYATLKPGRRAAIVTLNRPDQLNPLDWDTIARLEQLLAAIDSDDSVRTILLTGRGRAFSAGGDLKSYRKLQRDADAFPRVLEDFHRTLSSISQLSIPVVALVNGITVAGGLELLLSCDLAFAAQSARICDGHLKYGQMGGGGVLTLLPRTVGPMRARELVLSGRWLSAHEAADWGIVNSVVPDGELLNAGIEFASAVAERSSLAVRNAKQVMNKAWSDGTAIQAGLRLERQRTSEYCLTSVDASEGLEAFIEKRQPRFRGR
jgi:enoyl-CoA hydratase/carnithine racemase